MFIEQPPLILRWLYPRAFWRMDKNEKAVYLTFDDGPIPEIEAFYTVGIHKRRINEAEFQDAFRKMIDRNQETTVCFVVGSFYLAGMAKEFINQEEENVRL